MTFEKALWGITVDGLDDWEDLPMHLHWIRDLDREITKYGFTEVHINKGDLHINSKLHVNSKR